MNAITEFVNRLRDYAKARKGELASLINEAADTIEELSAKLSAEWIPVDERLPENDKPVLVTVDYKPVLVTVDWDHDDLEVCTAEYWPDFDGWANLEDYITAWRPLPEPYRGKTND